MTALFLCFLAFASCYWAGRRSLGKGLIMLLVFGYFYGILRANLLTAFSHFIFDAGMIGLFLSLLGRKPGPDQPKDSEALKLWTILLVGWPVLLVLLPFQPLLVSLVGLRGNVFFLPLLLVGSRLRNKDLIELSVGLAVLDLVAVIFGGAEYFMGVPRFYPHSPVTEIIYASGDVEGGFLRIPATFTSAHAFGGTMVGSIPFLIGLWTRAELRIQRLLALLATLVALLGVLMSATRQNFLFGIAMILFVLFTSKMKRNHRILFALVVAVVGVAAMTNVRFQRFKSLSDTESVTERIAGSVNRGFWEILTEYPVGNGLGGGGSSMPYFLQGQVRHPIGIENTYALILGEQGVIGLLLWVAFVFWFLGNYAIAFAKGPWSTTRRLSFSMAAIGLGTAWIGTGLLSSIPGTLMMILVIGWTSTRQTPERSRILERGLTQQAYRRAFSSAVSD
jgi:hypothetical protein